MKDNDGQTLAFRSKNCQWAWNVYILTEPVLDCSSMPQIWRYHMHLHMKKKIMVQWQRLMTFHQLIWPSNCCGSCYYLCLIPSLLMGKPAITLTFKLAADSSAGEKIQIYFSVFYIEITLWKSDVVPLNLWFPLALACGSFFFCKGYNSLGEWVECIGKTPKWKFSTNFPHLEGIVLIHK